MEQLLLNWNRKSPKAAVSIRNAVSDSATLLFFPSALPLSSFLLFPPRKKKPKTQRNVLMAERSHITAQTEPH